jgi:hypothetical protein
MKHVLEVNKIFIGLVCDLDYSVECNFCQWAELRNTRKQNADFQRFKSGILL